jgi:small membrane protein
VKPIQVVLLVMILAGLVRVARKYRQGSLRPLNFAFWCVVWIAGAAVVIWPAATTELATAVGIGRGTDLILYLSVLALFFLVLQVYIRLEYIQRDVTRLARNIALRDFESQAGAKRSTDADPESS